MAKSLDKLKVACILDEFSYECFRHECHLIKVGPDDWYTILAKEKPDLLLVESAWRGNDMKWRFKLGNYKNNNRQEISELIRWCKKQKIPTVFWNKEDPVHFNFYLDTAKLFDYVFTTDENCINEYKKELGHQNVFPLPFAAQPKIHNPIRVPKYRKKHILFAGTYYGNHHPERKKDMDLLLRIASKYGLEIFDRNHESAANNYRYPRRYQKNIKGFLPYNELVNASKQYKICLNVNSVKNSPTMCARRVFELLASGVTVLSNYSVAIESLFKETVPYFTNATAIQQTLIRALYDDEWRRRNELRGLRLVLQKHTYKHRLYKITEKLGLHVLPPHHPTVQVFGYAKNNEDIDNLIHSYQTQNYVNKKLNIFVNINNKEIDLTNYDNYKEDISFIKTKNKKEKIKTYINNYDYFTLFNSNHYYGPHYLSDLLLATAYTDAKIIGKASYYNLHPNFHLNTSKYIYSNCDDIRLDTCIIHTTLLIDTRTTLADVFDNKLSFAENSDVLKFSTDPLNFIRNYNKSKKPIPELINRITI